MRITQLIADLQRVLENDGDLRVYVDGGGDDYGFYAIDLTVERGVLPGTGELIIGEQGYEGN